MESLRGLPEHVEADFGDSIVARDEALAVLGASPALGPPDLCWLQKCPKRTGFFGGSGEAQGYYHYVLGRDVSSSAAIAAYFALLNSKVEHRTMLQGLWMSPEYVIERGFYCCYDPISRLDIRCELCIPGGVVVGCVDASGQLHDTTPQLWMQAQVSAFVRATLYDPEMRLNGGSVIAYEPCSTRAMEAALLSSVLELYRKGALPGGLQDINEEQGFGVSPEQTDVVLAALWQHFRRRQRWQAAAEFFRELMQVYSPAALLLAAAERAQGLGLMGHAGPLLSELLARPAGSPGLHSPQPLVPATMVGLGHELLEQGESEAAASLARRALAACPRCRPAWLLLAKCFVAERQYAAALVALNVVPTPPLPAAEVELLHVVPPPAPKATTQPQVRLYDGELESARWCALEEASLDGSRLLAYLPGSILVNREPLGSSFQPDICPNRITRSVLTAVYDLLQAIVTDITWDKFLEVRSSVFLMQHEVVQSPQHSTAFSPETAPHPQQSGQQDSPGNDLATLQAAQQSALLRKLEQLGLSADGQPDMQDSSAETAPPPPPSTQPPFGGADAATLASAAAAAAATAAGGSASAVPAAPGSAGPTPPASRGRLSSGGGGTHRGGGSPQSYYASRLQEELSRPLPPPGSAGRSSSTVGGQYSQLSLRLPGEQQQQQPVQPQATSPVPGASPGSAGSVAAPAPRPPGTPGAGQRSMAGRVLLLGKKAQPHSASSSRPPSARSVAPVGCGVPRSLAPNEVEDLSKYATASKVASLRVPASSGVMPELWNTVFGGGSSGGAELEPAAVGAGPPVSLRPNSSSADSDDGLSAAAAGLPRIRTRPLGEQVEDECWPASDDTSRGTQHCISAAVLPLPRYSSSMSSFLRRSTHYPSCNSSSSSTDAAIRSGEVCRSAVSSSRGWWRSLSADTGCRSGRDGSVHCSSSNRQQLPLGEGLDRTASLLNRSTSNASAAAAGGSSHGLPRSSSLRQAGSSGSALHSANSGSLSTARSRRLSLVGEAANRSLEADREGLCKGWLHDDASAVSGWGGGMDSVGSPGGSSRRLCVRWLDELIVALWHDLQAHMEWKVVDQTLRETRGGTAAELVLGMAPATVIGSPPSGAASTSTTPTGGAGGVNNGGAFEPPVLTCADWMRRGALAERLGHTLDARSAYRAAVKLSFNLTSYLALMRLEAEADSISNTALCASQILGWHQQRAGQHNPGGSSGGSAQGSAQGTSSGASSGGSSGATSASGGLVLMGVPPSEVTWALGLVADCSSVEEVRSGMADVPPAAQAMLSAVLDEWQRWQQVMVAAALAARQPQK